MTIDRLLDSLRLLQLGYPAGICSSIASTGIGLRYQAGDNFSIKLDYGIPLTTIDRSESNHQLSKENYLRQGCLDTYIDD